MRTLVTVTSRLATLAFILTALTGVSRADLITVTFDSSQATPAGETGSAPAGGTAANVFSLWGVQYELTGGDDGGCSSTGGNSLCFGDSIMSAGFGLSLLSDPVLSGPLVPGVALTLGFAAGTRDLSFSMALGTLFDTSSCPITAETYNGPLAGCPASVALYNAQGSLISGGTAQWQLPNDAAITEAAFSYSGAIVSQAILQFPGADSAGTAFAIDNLQYQTASTPTAPEPASLVLLILSACAAGVRRRFQIGRRIRTA